jgi:ABC-2 type transport system ATP-binding protein
MTSTELRLHEIKSYFDNGDIHVGYRRLLDSAIETQDMSIYQRTLEFCDWYDVNIAGETKNHSQLQERVSTLLDQITLANQGPVSPINVPRLKADKISKTYAAGSFSLTDVDIELYPTQIIGLVGENGNGKTTLLRLLYGELNPDSGTIQYNLSNVPANASFYDIKTRLAFIPQRPNAWYGSLMDNLQFTSNHYGYKGKENYLWTEMICARMGLRAFRTYTWNRISSGYKMRFELAKTLLKKPEILLLDEPLANLDMLAQQVILEDLRFLAQSERMPLGIILSSQQLYEVEKVSGQVIFLKQGKPKYQLTNGTPVDTETAQLVLELETSASREMLQKIFGPLQLTNLSFNGGVYLLYFKGEISLSNVITKLGESEIPVKYLRDISTSSRRFFDA